MWATEDLITSAQCDNVNIECHATDVCYVLKSYQDKNVNGQDVNLNKAKECLKQKCKDQEVII